MRGAGGRPAIQVVGEAEDGKRAIELCQALRPDVVTMDMMMPLMTVWPPPNTSWRTADAHPGGLVVHQPWRAVQDLRRAGGRGRRRARKPNGHEPEDQWERHFIATLKLVSRIRVITHLRAKLNGVTQPVPHRPCSTRSCIAACRLIAIGHRPVDRAQSSRCCAPVAAGASAGAAGAAHQRTVRHRFRRLLDAQTPRRVAYARDGEPAPRWLAASPLRRPTPPAAAQRPAAPEQDPSGIPAGLRGRAVRVGGAGLRSHRRGCLLTGMGRDGAAGLLALRRPAA